MYPNHQMHELPMLTPEQLMDLLSLVLDVKSPDREQREAILAPAGEGLRILAGPGTGKTACLVSRIMKLVLVDGVPPDGILALTFTRKAAAEMRSRILAFDGARSNPATDHRVRAVLENVDLAGVHVGTIDSFCARWVRESGDPEDPFITHIDDVGSAMVMEQVVRARCSREHWQDLVTILMMVGNPWLLDRDGLLRNDQSARGYQDGYRTDIQKQAAMIGTFWSHRLHDLVRWNAFRTEPGVDAVTRRARDELTQAHTDYSARLKTRGVMDYAMVQELARRLLSGPLREGGRRPAILGKLRALLVDEYQDTDILHQSIYLALAGGPACKGAMTIVGDDDQAIYRFRGGTVDLLAAFPDAYQRTFGHPPRTIQLAVNYRATPEISRFFTDFGNLDPAFQSARTGVRSVVRVGRVVGAGAPVLGLFRPTFPELARALAGLVRALVHDGVYETPAGWMVTGPTRSAGDIAVICPSPKERNAKGNLLPHYLRDELESDARPVRVWNPRGTIVNSRRTAALIGGLVLQCLDPDGDALRRAEPRLLGEAAVVMEDWIADLASFLDPVDPLERRSTAKAAEFIDAWRHRRRPDGAAWEPTVPVLTFLYEIAGALPDEVVDSAEFGADFGQFLRQAETCRWVAPEATVICHDPGDPDGALSSAIEVIVSLLGPVADGRRGVEDDAPGLFPLDVLPILSIHQSKGLEFPVTLVDAGCFVNPKLLAFLRFPTEGSSEHLLESMLRPFTELGARDRRPDLDLAFDDLIRKHYVAYSRSRDLLVLFGLSACAPDAVSSRPVRNIATGWTRDNQARWASQPPMVML